MITYLFYKTINILIIFFFQDLQEIVTSQVAVETCNQILNTQMVQDCDKVADIDLVSINTSCVDGVVSITHTNIVLRVWGCEGYGEGGEDDRGFRF